ncbi:MAG: hypothetical protein HeimC3_02790 [Candidatus Heimdallarchaeota archaeon LC_3]|nr:MAG: hypothetical protein HeimC3_02790 [Candidatus Heimdallarchaeota archaeon LC_3]
MPLALYINDNTKKSNLYFKFSTIPELGDTYKLELSEALEKEFVMIVDPNSYDYGDPTTFISNYWRENLEIAVVAKNELGKVSYRSFSGPRDPKYSEYFSSFVQIASEFEIPIHGVIHTLGDAFLASDPNYSVHRGGQEIPQFVCPSNTSFWKYSSTIAKEVGRYSISSLILDEHYYPRLDYCLCRRCRVEFRKLTGQDHVDITIEDLISDEDLLFAWTDWRSELLTSSLGEIIDSFKSEQPDTPIQAVIPVDPELEWLTGAAMHLGIDFEVFNQLLDGVVLSIMPFSPVYPITNTQSWLELVQRIKTVQTKYPNLKVSLLLNGIEQEWDVDWFKDLFKEIKGNKMFGKMGQGKLFNIKRELHRGVETHI